MISIVEFFSDIDQPYYSLAACAYFVIFLSRRCRTCFTPQFL